MSGRWYVGLLLAVTLVGCQEKKEPEEKVSLIKLPEAVNVNTAPPAPAPPPPAEIVPAVQPVATATQAPAPVATTPKPTPIPTATTPKPVPANSIAQCCASLHANAKSASFEQQPIYASAAQTCDAMGSAGLGTVRAMTMSVGVPDACR